MSGVSICSTEINAPLPGLDQQHHRWIIGGVEKNAIMLESQIDFACQKIIITLFDLSWNLVRPILKSRCGADTGGRRMHACLPECVL